MRKLSRHCLGYQGVQCNQKNRYEIWGFCSGEDTIWGPLGCDTM